MDSLGVTLTLIIYDSSLLAADTNNRERGRERESEKKGRFYIEERERERERERRLSPLCVPFH